MELWIHWYGAIRQLRPGFSRELTFLWFALSVAGLSVRAEKLGISSIVRALSLDPERCYQRLLKHCRSEGIKLTRLKALWSAAVMRLFASRVERVNGRPVLIADGKKVAKSGKKMPGVKLLHQESDSNTKPEFIMGHSTGAISMLVNAASSLLAVPLDIQIHEGVIFSNRDKRTLLDKALLQLAGLKIAEPCYLIADAYYASGKIVKGVLAQKHDLITRCKSNCVAYHRAPKPKKPRRGRPGKYGQSVLLRNLFRSALTVSTVESPLYDDKNVLLRIRSIELLWKPAAGMVRFVLVEHPTRGHWVLMCSDLTLAPIEIVRLYGLRFKIEFGFKQAAHVIGTFDYHFWMMDMKPLKRHSGNQFLHKETARYREAVRNKLHTYHVHLFMGVVTQGLMHYLSACHTDLVWKCFGSWLRTIRQGVAPSELVVALAMRNTLDEFLVVGAATNSMAKFITERQSRRNNQGWSNAA